MKLSEASTLSIILFSRFFFFLLLKFCTSRGSYGFASMELYFNFAFTVFKRFEVG